MGLVCMFLLGYISKLLSKQKGRKNRERSDRRREFKNRERKSLKEGEKKEEKRKNRESQEEAESRRNRETTRTRRNYLQSILPCRTGVYKNS